MKLTDSQIERAKPGAILRDDKVAGLQMRVRSRVRSWHLYYRTKDGKQRKPKLGEYPVMSIDMAREQAIEMLRDVVAGGDPSAARSEAVRAPKVSDLAEMFLAEVAPRRKTCHKICLIVENALVPKLGTMRVADVKLRHVQALHTELSATAPIYANRILRQASAMFAWAERWEMRPQGTNPCRHIEWNKENKRKRFITDAEFPRIREFLDREATERPAAVAFLYVLLFSGARPSEILGARRAWLTQHQTPHGPIGVLDLPDAKTGSRTVYLPYQALRVLDMVDPDDGTLTGLKSTPKKLWDKLRRELNLPDLWMRDSRRSFATVSMAAGQNISMVGELLGHANAQTTKTYARLRDESAKQAVVETARLMERLME